MKVRIPQDTNVKTYIFKNFTLKDIAVIGVVMLISLVLVMLPIKQKVLVISLAAVTTFVLLIRYNSVRVYEYIMRIFHYSISKRTYVKDERIKDAGIENIKENRLALLNGKTAIVMKLNPPTTAYLNEADRSVLMSRISSFLKSIDPCLELRLVKILAPYDHEKRIAEEIARAKKIAESENSVEKDALLNLIQSRVDIVDDIKKENLKRDSYYILIIGAENLAIDCQKQIGKEFESISIPTDKEMSVFIKHYILLTEETFEQDGDNDKNLGSKDIKVKANSIGQDNKSISHILVNKYPVIAEYGYFNNIFNINADVVELRIKALDKQDALKKMNKTALEIESRNTSVRSEQVEESILNESVSDLIYKIQGENAAFFSGKILIRTVDEQEQRANFANAILKLKQLGFSFDRLIFLQQEYINMFNEYNMQDANTFTNESLAEALAVFQGEINEESGMLIGENSSPVFINFFKRNNKYINSNCMVIGSTGGGKSYAVKTIALNLLSDKAKMYILDPEGEYIKLASSVGGQVIDVGIGMSTSLNPFAINKDNSLSQHLIFLDEYYKNALSLDMHTHETLNNLIALFYSNKRITENKVNEGMVNTYPGFNSFVMFIEKMASEASGQELERIENILIHLRKYVGIGRESIMKSSDIALRQDASLYCFNFQKLFFSKNTRLINSQMLLTLKFVESMLLQNYKNGDRTVIVIDEAHLFFSEENTAALDFMYQLAKRIRKYNGMQIVVTQNIKDFTASKELQKKTQAIINASQYSLIFPLHPADVKELKELYRTGGGLEENECDEIARNSRGRAYMICAPDIKDNINIYATAKARELFE